MAKLKVAEPVLIGQLFIGAAPEVRVHGAEFDQVTRELRLDISGPGLPADDREVKAVITTQRATVEFKLTDW